MKMPAHDFGVWQPMHLHVDDSDGVDLFGNNGAGTLIKLGFPHGDPLRFAKFGIDLSGFWVTAGRDVGGGSDVQPRFSQGNPHTICP